jgi:predicted RND superfamily exporter protein
MQSSLFQIYDRLILRQPRIALLIMLLFALSMALGLPNFKLDASADSLTLENDDDLNFSREVVKRYGSDNFFIVTFSPINGDLFSQDNLNTLTELRNGLTKIEGVEGVLSMLDVPLL